MKLRREAQTQRRTGHTDTILTGDEDECDDHDLDAQVVSFRADPED